MPKATARRGWKRVPDHIRKHMQPPMSKAGAEEALAAGSLDPTQGRVIWNVAGRPVRQAVTRFEVPDGLRLEPARRIGTRPDAPNRIGNYPVYRDGCALSLAVESRLEMTWLRWYDMQPDVDWMQTQPFVLTWDVGDEGLHAFPDLLVRQGHRWVVVEVKPTRLMTPHAARKFRLAQQAFETTGVQHVHRPETSPQAEQNLRVISCYKRVNPEYVSEMERLFAARPAYFADAVRILGDAGVAFEAVMTLVANGNCTLDLDEPFVATSHLFWSEDVVRA